MQGKLVPSSEAWALAVKAAHRHAIVLGVFHAIERLTPSLATGAIIETRGELRLVTAAHVFHALLALGEQGRLQIGMHGDTVQLANDRAIRFAPDGVDLAWLPLPGRVEDTVPIPGDSVSSSPPDIDDVVAFVGYPGAFKARTPGTDRVNIGTSEHVLRVRTVEGDQFSMLVDETHTFGAASKRPGFSALDHLEQGGLSGAPIWSVATTPKVVGFVHQGQAFDSKTRKLYAVHARTLIGCNSACE